MKYVVAGNAVSERITFADGTSTEFMPGGATLYALLGIQLWTDEVLLCGGFGQDYMEQIGEWLTRNHINRTGFNVRDERNPVNYMFYKDEGIWDSKTEYGVEHWDRLDCNPTLDQLGKYTEDAVGLAVFRGRDQEFYEQIFALREKQGFKLGWEIKGNYAVPEYLPEIRELLKSVDSFSINQTEAFCLFQVENDDAAIKALQALEVPLVLYRVGKRGIYILLEGKVLFAPAFTKYKVKDVTGCGNSSTSAGFYAWCEGKDIYEIAAHANVTAGHNLRYSGAMELSAEERKIAEQEMEEFASELRKENER